MTKTELRQVEGVARPVLQSLLATMLPAPVVRHAPILNRLTQVEGHGGAFLAWVWSTASVDPRSFRVRSLPEGGVGNFLACAGLYSSRKERPWGVWFGFARGVRRDSIPHRWARDFCAFEVRLIGRRPLRELQQAVGRHFGWVLPSPMKVTRALRRWSPNGGSGAALLRNYRIRGGEFQVEEKLVNYHPGATQGPEFAPVELFRGVTEQFEKLRLSAPSGSGEEIRKLFSSPQKGSWAPQKSPRGKMLH